MIENDLIIAKFNLAEALDATLEFGGRELIDLIQIRMNFNEI